MTILLSGDGAVQAMIVQLAVKPRRINSRLLFSKEEFPVKRVAGQFENVTSEE